MLGEIPREKSSFEVFTIPERQRFGKWLDGGSYEVLPTQKAFNELYSIPKDRVISVTSSPTKTVEHTIEFLEALIRLGRKVVPHLASRHFSSSDHASMILKELELFEIKRFFSIAGDNEKSAGPFGGSLDFIKETEKQGVLFERIDIAGYPEGHPKISNEVLNKTLLEKQEWAEKTNTKMNIITQICFDARTIIDWVEKIRKMGVELPVTVGVPGNLSAQKLIEFAIKSGVGDSVNFMKSNAAFAFNLSRAAFGNYDPSELLVDLNRKTSDDHKIEGIHIFTFNNIVSTNNWLEDTKKSL
jgi:methylenetetrahydrofolate reductase (NADPH)